MSASAATGPAAVESVHQAHELAFRIAFAAAAGFTLGHMLGWDFPFLPPLFAVQLLTASRSLNLKQSLGFVILMSAGCVFGLLIAEIFAETPLVLLLALALLIFLGFLMLARGQAVPVANILLITVSVVPLVAVSSVDAAYGLVFTLLAGSVLAVLLVFLAYAFFPAQGDATAAEAPAVEDSPVSAALANAAVLMSLVILFVATPSPVSFIVILTAITILRQPALGGGAAAYGLIMGNVAGGLAATLACLVVVLSPSPAFLLLVTLFFGLVFGAKIAAGRESSPVYTVGLVTFLIVLGLGLAPLPGDSGTVFVSRVVNVILAAVYTIGLASVLRSLFQARIRVCLKQLIGPVMPLRRRGVSGSATALRPAQAPGASFLEARAHRVSRGL